MLVLMHQGAELYVARMRIDPASTTAENIVHVGVLDKPSMARIQLGDCRCHGYH